MRYVISYDISDDAVRTRVAEAVDDYGVRVQYSVFECTLTGPDLSKLRGRLKRLVRDHTGASVRFYPLCDRCSASIQALESTGEVTDEGFVIV